MIWDVGRHTFRYDWNQSSSHQSCSSCLHLHYVRSPTHRSAIPIPIQEDRHSNKDTNSTTIAHGMSQEQHSAQLMNLPLTRTVLLLCDLPAWTASSLLRLSSACHTWSSRFHLNCFKLGGCLFAFQHVYLLWNRKHIILHCCVSITFQLKSEGSCS